MESPTKNNDDFCIFVDDISRGKRCVTLNDAMGGMKSY